MDYGDFQDLPRRKASDKVLSNKAFNIAKNSKYVGYKRIFYFIKGTCVIGL